MVPRVAELQRFVPQQVSHPTSAPFRKGSSKGKGRGLSSHAVHEVEHDGQDDDMETEEDDSDGGGYEGGPVPTELEMLEREAEVLLTQAKKRRAETENARGYFKGAGKGADAKGMSDRVRQMKARMPCSRCKEHGKVVYGHWKDDLECPYFVPVEETGKPSNVGLLTMACFTNLCFSSRARLRQETMGQALPDTQCAKSCMGKSWYNDFKSKLAERFEKAVPLEFPEHEPFRFGPGARVYSEKAAYVPMGLGGKVVFAKVSLVDADVPLLLSKGLLEGLGMIMDMGKKEIIFKTVDALVRCFDTSTGHMRFSVLDYGKAIRS